MNSKFVGQTILLVPLVTGLFTGVINLQPVRASIFSGTESVMIREGTSIPVRYDEAEKIVVAPTETVPLTLKVASNVRDRSGKLLIPAGTEIKGELIPVSGGSQFVAQDIIFEDNTSAIVAKSQVVTTTQEVRPGVNTDAVWKGAAIGSGAATLISAITGRVGIGKVLAGAGAGALGGMIFGRNRAKVVVINPNTDLTLTLSSGLTVSVNDGR